MKRILLSFAALLLFVFANAQTEQTIQDTFLKMKLGQEFTMASIKNHVGDRGTFDDVYTLSSYRTVDFIDFTFGGATWNLCKFYLTNSGLFYKFELSSHFDSERDALERYNSLVNRLNKKYTCSYTEEEANQKGAGYFGVNGIGCLVSYIKVKPENGYFDYYFVYLSYLDFELYTAVQNAQDDEL